MIKQVLLMVAGACALSACGAADETTSAQEETTGAESSALVNAWTSYVSEEAGHNIATCGSDANVGVTAARCTGSYCDNMSFYCSTLPSQFTSWLDGNAVWTTPYISEESGNNQVMCPTDGPIVPRIIDGIRATGSYSDNISVHCRDAWLDLPDSTCTWTPYFSEEQYQQTFKVNALSYLPAVALGVRCSGSYCDNLSFYICEPNCTSNDQCFGVCINGHCGPG